MVVEPLTKKYQDMMRFLNRDDDRVQEIRERLLGPDLIKHASMDWWELTAMESLHISPVDWQAMSLRERGKILAYTQMRNRLQTYERFADEMKPKKKADS